MIRSFKCEDTEALSKGRPVRRFVNMAKLGRRKLRQLEIAARLDDLRIPPGNHLEALKGERAGQHSIRINDQWRVCFRWTDAGVEDVEIVCQRLFNHLNAPYFQGKVGDFPKLGDTPSPEQRGFALCSSGLTI